MKAWMAMEEDDEKLSKYASIVERAVISPWIVQNLKKKEVEEVVTEVP